MKILGTGLSGLVGSRITELLKNKYEFENLSLETGIDITDKKGVIKRIENSDSGVVLHLAAKADVDGCETDKILGKKGDAWKVNVLGTKNVVDACQKTAKKIIYISTDLVFDGENGPYQENDTPFPINWYGQTKFQGEEIVRKSGLPFLIMRIAYPYRARFGEKTDFVRSIVAKLQNKEQVQAVEDHVMTPTFIDDIAVALDRLIEKEVVGIYHVVGSQFIAPFDAALTIAHTFGYDSSLVARVKREKYFEGRAKRPFNLSLKNDKLKQLGIKMLTFQEGLKEVKKQL